MAATGSGLMEGLKGKPQPEAEKIASSSYFSKKLQILCYGHIIFLLSTWQVEKNFPLTQTLSSADLENYFWVS